MYQQKPVISIITVVFNAVDCLEATILSVLKQTYGSVEFIVVDGNSTDGTVDVIKQYNDGIDYWISETDTGIYNAMNKGIIQAAGDWYLFLNAGDELYDPSTLDQVVAKLDNRYCLCVGDFVLQLADGTRRPTVQKEKLINYGVYTIFNHQTTFYNVEKIGKENIVFFRELCLGRRFPLYIDIQ